jgi:hypothetical protein
VITGSILLALVAAVFLLLGLVSSNGAELFYSSIVASVLAGFALFAGLRHRPGAQLPDDDFDGPVPSDRDRAGPVPIERHGAATSEPEPPALERSARATGRASVAVGDPRTPDGWEEGAAVATAWPDDDDQEVPDGLPDEPGEQELTAYVAGRMAELGAEVAVIDGRPRYHLDVCLHLLGRTVDRLPVKEAVELGFTPCADCKPGTALLGSAPF